MVILLNFTSQSRQIKAYLFYQQHLSLEALFLLNKCNNADYFEVLKAAVNDPYELIRRQAARMIGDSGSDELVPALVQLALSSRNNLRVAVAAKSSLSFMNTKAVIAATNNNKIISDANYTAKKLEEDSKVTFDPQAELKQRYFNITTLRNYNYHSLVPKVIALAEDKKDNEKLRVAAIEALSWFTHSYQRVQILQLCDKILQDKEDSNAVHEQAERTRAILQNF